MEAREALRKNVAIVFCDIAGFTDLIATQGDLVAVNLLHAYFDQVGRLANEFHSLTIKFIGDAFFAAFEDINQSMPFVLAVQDLVSETNVLAGRGVSFKFSLHIGEVIYTHTSYGPDIFGQHVNTAAHLNARAEPDQLAVSQTALDQLPDHLRSQAGPAESLSLRHSAARAIPPVAFRRINLPLSRPYA